MIKEIPIRTTRRNEMIDITHLVEKEIGDVEEGVVMVFVPHTTAGVMINENADPDVRRDILKKLSELIPKDDGYDHAEGNSDSHIKTLVTGSSVQVIARKGKLMLGTWQSIFFCEYDGPRSRRFIMKC